MTNLHESLQIRICVPNMNTVAAVVASAMTVVKAHKSPSVLIHASVERPVLHVGCPRLSELPTGDLLALRIT